MGSKSGPWLVAADVPCPSVGSSSNRVQAKRATDGKCYWMDRIQKVLCSKRQSLAWHLLVIEPLIQPIQEAQYVPVPARDHERKNDTRHVSNWRFLVWQAQVHGRETVSQVSIEFGYLPSNTLFGGVCRTSFDLTRPMH